jgi:hypothetical protein
VRLHQLGPAGDAADDGVDQVSEVVVIEECLDCGLGVVADNHKLAGRSRGRRLEDRRRAGE